MKRLFLALLCCGPLLVSAQSVPVPTDLYFAGLRLRLTEGGRKAVQQKVDALRSHPASFQARVVLADAYFPLIDRVFQEEALPLDFRYLALQESGLQGEAQSIHDAVGYWQFKRETAQDFGLVMNDAVDERKHIVASSHAAAKYLKRNNAPLHNWLDALLSYNLGSGGVKTYILPTDYDATEMEISEQTHPYILTLLAHKIAYEPAVGHNPKPALQLQEFPAPAGFSLVSIAQTLQTDGAELTRHNRWLLAGTVPSDKIYTLLVPITDPVQLTAMAAQQKNATAGQLLNKPQTDPQNVDYVRVNGLRALVALPGDTKESMAKRAGLKMRKFMRFNDLFAFDNIVAGQPYFVQKKRDKGEVEYHVAQPGESVATVSQKYGIRAKAIWSKNRMPRNEELRAGRILWLQHTRPKEVAIEYADNKNAAALAAFERPTARPATAAPQPTAAPAKATTPKPKAAPAEATPAAPEDATASTPEPMKATAKKRKIDETEPYMGKTAGASRVVEDAEADEEDGTAATIDNVTQPDSATDATTENLNELLTNGDTKPATASVSKPAATPSPTAPAPAPRAVYTGRPAKKPLPTTNPVADEPVATASETPATTKPVAAPAPKPAPTATAVPASPAATATNTARPLPPSYPVAAGTIEPIPASGTHTVQPKESLYSVARRYGLRPADLVIWNDLPQNPSLRLGQTLHLTAPGSTTAAVAAAPALKQPTPSAAKATEAVAKPTASEPAVAAPVATIKHTVAAGESMYAISRKYKVTIKQIMEWNNKPDFNVKPGEVLLVKPAN